MQTPRSPHAQENKETKKCAKKQNKKHSPWNLDLLNKKLFKNLIVLANQANLIFFFIVQYTSRPQYNSKPTPTTPYSLTGTPFVMYDPKRSAQGFKLSCQDNCFSSYFLCYIRKVLRF